MILIILQVEDFYDYFKESGTFESRLEKYRIRKLINYYYLEDWYGSIQIIEPKFVNADATQGA